MLPVLSGASSAFKTLTEVSDATSQAILDQAEQEKKRKT